MPGAKMIICQLLSLLYPSCTHLINPLFLFHLWYYSLGKTGRGHEDAQRAGAKETGLGWRRKGSGEISEHLPIRKRATTQMERAWTDRTGGNGFKLKTVRLEQMLESIISL